MTRILGQKSCIGCLYWNIIPEYGAFIASSSRRKKKRRRLTGILVLAWSLFAICSWYEFFSFLFIRFEETYCICIFWWNIYIALFLSVFCCAQAHMVWTRIYKTSMEAWNERWKKAKKWIQSCEIVKREWNSKQRNDDEDGGVDIDPMQSFA